MPSRKPNRHKSATVCRVRFSPLTGGPGETVRATPIARERLRLDEIPVMTDGISYHDLVQASMGDPPGMHDFIKMIQKSGHRTLRFTTAAMHHRATKLPQLLARLVEAGCSHENKDQRFYAINVPPLVDITAIGAMLTEAAVTWNYADPVQPPPAATA
jgi:hypothetical protein